jgi:quercetin dioxygenase-like cupin family protein
MVPSGAPGRTGAGRPRAYTVEVDALGDIGSVPAQQIWEGIAGRAVHGERLTLGLIELEPEAVLPEHRHENEQLGMVLEGSITFTIGAERQTLGPGGTWRIPSNVPHEAVIGPEGAVVIDVFSPVREDWKVLPEATSGPPRWP